MNGYRVLSATKAERSFTGMISWALARFWSLQMPLLARVTTAFWLCRVMCWVLGRLSLTQLVCVAMAFTGDLPLDGPYRLAGGLDEDGKISRNDLCQVAEAFTRA